jgi:hypothetical protein
MSDSNIIWKFLQRQFPDDHPVIYIYVCGQKRSEITAIDKMMSLSKQIFCPTISENFVNTIVKSYLDRKKNDYKLGKIKVKSIYD